MSNKITISIADDHTLFRTALAGLLEDLGEFEVCTQAVNGKELMLKLNDATVTDVVLVDIEMPEMDGPTTVRALREKFGKKLKILGLSMHKEYRMVNEMLECGANGFLSKDAGADELQKAINAVVTHDFYLSPEMSKLMFGKHYKIFETAEKLNNIEIDIIRLVCEQKTNAEIAERLNLSLNTINSYRTRILDKVGAANTAGLVIYAVRNNIFKL